MRRPFEIPTDIYPFEDRWLEVQQGAPIHYVDEGSGPTLLMCHGNPTWSLLYSRLIRRLSGQFRCVAHDLAGFGMSPAPTGFGFTAREQADVVEAFVTQLDLRDVTLVVQDWGGPTGLGLARRHPDRIRAVVIGNTFAWSMTGDRSIRLFSALMGGPLGRAVAKGFNGVARFFFREGFRTDLTAAERAAYLAPFRARSDRAQTSIFPRELIKAAEFLSEVESALESISDRPALFIWAEKDFAFGHAYRERFASVCADHRTVALPNAGHFWQHDAADVAATEIERFLT